ncbi:MAG TPA: hypothetical protein G4N92_00055 [Anaerolineae bacterium]|nr:hypothetical protein [Anaerolineae bacterium]
MKKVKKSDVLSLCLEYNFWTWSAQKEIHPIPVDKAEGIYFWDFEGKQ